MKKDKDRHQHSQKNKKKKKKRKSKHRHSVKEDKQHCQKSENSSSDSENSIEEKEENEGHHHLNTKKREDWMNSESFVPTYSKQEISYSSSRQRKIDAVKEQEEKEKMIRKNRELNPFLKNESSKPYDKGKDVDILRLPSTSVGDGGYSWLKRAYYRIQEQAQRENRPMEEVAVERWGSLNNLESKIEEAEKRMKIRPTENNYSKQKYLERIKSEGSRTKSFKKPKDYTSSHFDSTFKFSKPSSDHKERRKINHFQSSSYKHDNVSVKEQKSDYLIYPSKSQTSSSETSAHMHFENLNKQSIPAWKKPKYSAESSSEDISLPKNLSVENKHEKDSAPIMYSENDLSKLAAKQLKAEIMGNTTLAEKLKSQLETARKQIQENGFAQFSKVCKEVVLTKINSAGQEHPIQTLKETSDLKRKSKTYVDEDNKYSLKQMFEREKLTTVDDHLEMFVDAANTQCGEAMEIDFEEENSSKKVSQKMSVNRQEERDVAKAIRQHHKRNSAVEKCEYCLDQRHVKKHLIVDIGELVYLSLPNYQSLTEGHCLIVPKAHVPSFLHLDENEWRESEDYKSLIRRLFRCQEKSVIFLETSMHFRHYPHAVVECIPMSEEDGSIAPFYFKKGIQESEEEWALNKKLVELSKGLRQSVPKQLSYFHVEFDPKIHPGFAHVIEEEKYFPRNFGKEILGGILDIDYNHLYKNRREDPLKKAKEVLEFIKMVNKFKK